MSENLKVTHYRNGDPIPQISDIKKWSEVRGGACCFCDKNVIYNWYAVNDPRGIAPRGWHVATNGEWKILMNLLGGYAIAGGKLKEAGIAHWSSPNTGATNSSGFTAIPNGYKVTSGYLINSKNIASFWTSTELNSHNAWHYTMYHNTPWLSCTAVNKNYGHSVRCVLDYKNGI